MTRKHLITAAVLFAISRAAFAGQAAAEQCTDQLKDIVCSTSSDPAKCEHQKLVFSAMVIANRHFIFIDSRFDGKYIISTELVESIMNHRMSSELTQVDSSECDRAIVMQYAANLYAANLITFDKSINQYTVTSKFMDQVPMDHPASGQMPPTDPSSPPSAPGSGGGDNPAPSNECGGFTGPDSQN